MDVHLAEMPLPFRFRPPAPMTDEELMRFSQANETLCIEREANGEIVVMTPVGSKTGRTNAYITQMLGIWSDNDGRGLSFDSNTGFTLPDGSMRSPDAAWLTSQRWNALSDEDQDRFAPLCPEFVIELRSPTDALAELEAKMEQWIANGAQLAWLIDPQRKVVAIYRPGHSPEVHVEPNSVQGDGPVVKFELLLERVWR